jgi:1-acyl-sn-glycerol-3-phosphate acyltransferase
MTLVMKKVLLYSGPFGIVCYLARAIFIGQNSEKEREKLNRMVKTVVKSKAKLWIFPEGNFEWH